MYLGEIPVGATVELEITRGERTKTFRTKIETKEGNTLRVLVPMSGLDDLKIKETDKIILIYNDGASLKGWRCCLASISDSAANFIVGLCSDAECVRINRRNGYRIACIEPITYIFEGKVRKGYLKNISLMGVAIETEMRHKEGERLDISVKILDTQLKKTIVLVRDIEASSGRYGYGAKFLDDSDTKLEKLLTNLQREELRKLRNCK